MAVRIPTVAELTTQQKQTYDLFPTNLTRALVLTKTSAEPYLALGNSFRDGWLAPDVRELVILRVGARTRAAYQLYFHVPEATAAGVTETVITAVTGGATSFGDDRLDVLIGFIDQLVDGVPAAPPDTTAISEHFSDSEIAEIVLLTGHYVMTALLIKALHVEPDGTTPPSSDLLAGRPGSTQGRHTH